jgi:organic radical activating enzyme
MPALLADVIPSSCVDGPGNRYVLFLQGCTFNCLACHNPQTIARHPTPTTSSRSVDDLLADIAAAAPFLSGVTVSGGEATCQWQVIDELFRRLRSLESTASLSLLVDSNGDADQHVWDALADSMDGAMIDHPRSGLADAPRRNRQTHRSALAARTGCQRLPRADRGNRHVVARPALGAHRRPQRIPPQRHAAHRPPVPRGHSNRPHRRP